MSTRKISRLNASSDKATQVEDQQNAGAVAVVTDAAAVKPTPPIFNLNDDCCFAIFDWLPRKSLNSFGQACKWAQRVAAHFYQMKHSAMECEVNSSHHISGLDVFDLKNTQKLRIWGTSLDSYRHVKSYFNRPIKQISLGRTTLSLAEVNCLKKVLRTVECVKMDNCIINGDFHEDFLTFCPNLKVLCIYNRYGRFIRNPNGNQILIGVDNGWLARKYPTLERLEVIHNFAQKIDELKTFFEQNPNIRSLITNSVFLVANWDLFRTANIKLDTLAIRFDNADNVMGICDSLNALHERGVFKRLHCYNKSISDQLASLNAMEKLAITSWSAGDCANISPLLINIKELSIDDITVNSHMETTARNLVNLERVYLSEPTSAAIMSFIRHSPKLRKIKVEYGSLILNSKNDGLDLAALNNERAKLAGARKVTIYVGEGVYLAIKWATTKTDYSLIELRRENSYDWDEDFIY
ncbi:uncharacterized protein LOC129569873 [Sitodiplosis mosellana]|uniref:uncharacterized protein LOC129569873 n=1 Tax=Sitodiplosis mosellana TaxID=263140 RepID=UPI002444CFC6|nr:uncharacterized protein LOC129569873 [Sitodiplosis mosellana]